MSFWDKILKLLGLERKVEPNSPKTPVEVETVALEKDDSEYRALFDRMQIRESWAAQVNAAVDKILKGRDRYERLQKETKVPWYMIGCIHLLEGSCNFGTHLHNGDSLSRRTVHVPAGRPRTGTPPFTWEESAEDALSYDGIKPPLNTIGEQFKALERFNGMGYRNKGIKTPYLWSGSNHYVRGKYVADGKYDPAAVSKQVGAASIYRVLKDRGIISV